MLNPQGQDQGQEQGQERQPGETEQQHQERIQRTSAQNGGQGAEVSGVTDDAGSQDR